MTRLRLGRSDYFLEIYPAHGRKYWDVGYVDAFGKHLQGSKAQSAHALAVRLNLVLPQENWRLTEYGKLLTNLLQ